MTIINVPEHRQDPNLYEGVITLVDSAFFTGFVLLYESIQITYPVPVTCFDGGMTDTQRLWAKKYLKNCTIKPIPDEADIKLVMDKLSGVSANGTRESMLWICPFLIANSPYQRVLWLDSDLVVIKQLGNLFERIDDGPVFTLENLNPAETANHPSLYDEMPLRQINHTKPPLVNGGVSGWDTVRDAAVIKDYMKPVLRACENEKLRQSISWHDQGCLIWAIENNEMHDRVITDTSWNLCARHSVKEVHYSLESNLNEQLREAYPDTNIAHWNGFPLPEKLFSILGSENDILDAVLKRLPGAHYVGDVSMKDSRIKLISHISSATPAPLLTYFIEHYQNSQVDDFLIILHKANGDSRLTEKILSKYGITPAMCVTDYSAKLKNQRIIDIKSKYVSADDWVIYADVDEFQVYPTALKQLLTECDERGYQSLPGSFIDRIAENGELKEIKENLTIWEQFPYMVDVSSEVTGAWNRKICVAKGSVPLDYSGAHYRLYGCDYARDYKATYLDSTNWPENTEIHHFKWDATLRSRIEQKINGDCGDRDAIDGESFMHEYHALLSHLNKHKRIAVSGFRRAKTPPLKLDV